MGEDLARNAGCWFSLSTWLQARWRMKTPLIVSPPLATWVKKLKYCRYLPLDAILPVCTNTNHLFSSMNVFINMDEEDFFHVWCHLQGLTPKGFQYIHTIFHKHNINEWEAFLNWTCLQIYNKALFCTLSFEINSMATPPPPFFFSS